VGARVRLGGSDTWVRIVGVVADSRYNGPAVEVGPEAYRPHMQNPYLQLVALHTAVPEQAVMASVRKVVRRLDPELAITQVRTGGGGDRGMRVAGQARGGGGADGGVAGRVGYSDWRRRILTACSRGVLPEESSQDWSFPTLISWEVVGASTSMRRRVAGPTAARAKPERLNSARARAAAS